MEDGPPQVVDSLITCVLLGAYQIRLVDRCIGSRPIGMARRLFPASAREAARPVPDWLAVHRELKKHRLPPERQGVPNDGAFATGSLPHGRYDRNVKTVLLGERPPEVENLLQRRRALGQDGFDEVWEGAYHMAPMAHAWHGYVDNQLAVLLNPYARRAGLVGTGPFNLGEPSDFRVPDRGYHRTVPSAVYVPAAAIVVEVVSPDDETWEKFGFYAAHGVEEICTAEPLERRLRWWRREDQRYVEVESSDLLGMTVAEIAARIDWPR